MKLPIEPTLTLHVFSYNDGIFPLIRTLIFTKVRISFKLLFPGRLAFLCNDILSDLASLIVLLGLP